SIEVIYDQIIDDLTLASDLMPISRDAGRADKVAAQSLLAKVYVTMASSAASGRPEFSFVSDPESFYARASEEAAKVVFDQTEYGFEDALIQIYNVETRADLNGKEHIFFINFDRESASNEVIGSKTGLFFWPGAGVLGLTSGTCGTQLFTRDGRSVFNGFSVYQTLPGFLDTYEPNDRRRTELVVDSLFDAGGNLVWTPSFADAFQVPFSAKYLDFCSQEFTQTRPMVIRFSDILLIYAEGQGPTAAGYEAVNRIRQRAGLAALSPGLSAEDFRKAIIQERAWELAFEGHRLYDTRRTNSVEEAFAAVGAENLLIGTENLYFFPIPDLEILLNQ
ncbi:MAG: RagB/SusD family nutrient uptake outer membrane protein, partial [Bacteroidota bacterium]